MIKARPTAPATTQPAIAPTLAWEVGLPVAELEDPDPEAVPVPLLLVADVVLSTLAVLNNVGVATPLVNGTSLAALALAKATP